MGYHYLHVLHGMSGCDDLANISSLKSLFLKCVHALCVHGRIKNMMRMVVQLNRMPFHAVLHDIGCLYHICVKSLVFACPVYTIMILLMPLQ